MADWGKILSRGDVEDRRGFAPVALGGLSLTGVVLLVVVNYLLGGDVTDVLRQVERMPVTQQQEDIKQYEGTDSYEVFVSTVLGSNNDVWRSVFSGENKNYHEPKLVLFRSATQSGCGTATSDVGPHYCPVDETVYLDETFFDELTSRFGAQGGDVAQAYVIAHEVGHHAQNLLGTMDSMQGRTGESDNDFSVKLELQADCYAGMWANSIKDKGILEPGEIKEAMDAASAVGDDRIQKRVNGYVNPETWTHGSSEQRVSWFNKGFENGSLKSCNTFD